MAKPTQAHLSRTIPCQQSNFLRERTRSQMEYYMGAKLLEVGVNPKSAVYRWKTVIRGSREIITCSAYWGESRTELEATEAAGQSMATPPPEE